MDFIQQSYAIHAQHMEKDLTAPERIPVAMSWFDETTADYWRHSRFYTFLEAFEDKSSSWITIGDGRWGLDSIRIKKKGFTNVLPTDISEGLLAEGKERGYIEDYRVENAEKLSFADDSFDYAFCKDAFHHFPRPYIALYEMLRVARRGIFLIEHNDKNPGVFTSESFESVGNFVYSISLSEAQKIALGIDLPQLLFSGINNYYIKGVEFEPADPAKSPMFKKILSEISNKDELCLKGGDDYDMLSIGFLKMPLDGETLKRLIKQGWHEAKLPRNPYTA